MPDAAAITLSASGGGLTVSMSGPAQTQTEPVEPELVDLTRIAIDDPVGRPFHPDWYRAPEPEFDVVALIKIGWRRWYVVLAGIVLTAASALAIAREVQPTYEMETSYLVSGPQFRGEAGAGFVSDSNLLAPIIVALNGAAGSVVPDGTSAEHEVVAVAPDVIEVIGSASDLRSAVQVSLDVADTARMLLEARQLDLGIEPARSSSFRTLLEPDAETGEGVQTAPGTEGQPPTYRAVTSLVLERAPSSGANPFASASVTYRVLEEVLESSDRAGRISVDETTYGLSRQARDAAPVIYFRATGTDAQATASTMEALLIAAKDELRDRQDLAGVPTRDRVSLEILAADPEPLLTSSNLVRPLAVVIGLGGLLTLSITVAIDRILRHTASQR